MQTRARYKTQGSQEISITFVPCAVWTAERFYYPNTLGMDKLNIFTAITEQGITNTQVSLQN